MGSLALPAGSRLNQVVQPNWAASWKRTHGQKSLSAHLPVRANATPLARGRRFAPNRVSGRCYELETTLPADSTIFATSVSKRGCWFG